MERAALLGHLETAKRRAQRDRAQISRQKQIIEELQASGADTSRAEKLLKAFEQTHNSHLSDMDRILNELNNADGAPPRDIAGGRVGALARGK